MCHKKPDGGEATEAVQSRRFVTSNHLVNPRRAGEQKNADERKEGAVERGELADHGDHADRIAQQ